MMSFHFDCQMGERMSAMKLGIGIDTGGTCTDAVIYDFETQAILG